jgi:hypothetical protein
MWTKYSVNDFDDDDQRYQIFLDRIDEFNFKNNKDKIKRKKDKRKIKTSFLFSFYTF